jgi:hypothetical protein
VHEVGKETDLPRPKAAIGYQVDIREATPAPAAATGVPLAAKHFHKDRLDWVEAGLTK